jgi:hypothetical protein
MTSLVTVTWHWTAHGYIESVICAVCGRSTSVTCGGLRILMDGFPVRCASTDFLWPTSVSCLARCEQKPRPKPTIADCFWRTCGAAAWPGSRGSGEESACAVGSRARAVPPVPAHAVRSCRPPPLDLGLGLRNEREIRGGVRACVFRVDTPPCAMRFRSRCARRSRMSPSLFPPVSHPLHWDRRLFANLLDRRLVCFPARGPRGHFAADWTSKCRPTGPATPEADADERPSIS